MTQKFHGVKGMNDLLPGEIEVWQRIERTAREVFQRYGYQEVRTPVLEDTALFTRSVGEQTDIVGKEMYTFEDKGGRSLSLRPEGTAPSARAYLEHAFSNREPVTKWFYIGQMFRYERMKTGRYRQFWQIGCETYGVSEPTQEVEQMELAVRFIEALGLQDVSLSLNSLGDDQCRPAYQAQLVSYFTEHLSALCADCQERLVNNPLRILDCKNVQCQAVAKDAPSVLSFLCEPCRSHFDEVKRQLTLLKVRFQINPQMVRGLDYYTRTAFEFIAASPVLSTASSVGGGGRYDKLLSSLGGSDTPAVGFGLGLDRLCLLMADQAPGVSSSAPLVFLVNADPESKDAVLEWTSKLRHAGLRAEMDARGGSLKSQMKRADKSRARFALVIGQREIAEGRVQLKSLHQEVAPRTVEWAHLESELKDESNLNRPSGSNSGGEKRPGSPMGKVS